MLAALNEIAPLVIVIVGMGIVGIILAILWFRAMSPSEFNKDTVIFIVKIFSAIAAGSILLGVLMKHC